MPRHVAAIGAIAVAIAGSGTLVVIREHLREHRTAASATLTSASAAPRTRTSPHRPTAPRLPAAPTDGRADVPATAPLVGITDPTATALHPRTSTVPTSAGDAAPPSASTPASPTAHQPSEGTYAYVEDVNGGSDQPATLTVYDDGSTTTATLADDDGQQTEEATWTSTARTLVATTADGQRCEWSPATAALPFPLYTGRTWSTTSRCTVHIGRGATATVDESEDSAVKGWAVVRIGGSDIAVWAVTRHTTITETTTTKAGTSTATAESQRTELFAPELGIDVQITEQSIGPDQHGTSRQTYSILRLTSTQPQPT